MNVFYEELKRKNFFYEDRDIFFPAHIHKEVELFYLLEGEVRLMVQNKEYLLKEREILCIFPNCIHSYETRGTSRFYIGMASEEALGGFSKIFHSCYSPNPVAAVKDLHPDAMHCMNSMAELFKKEEEKENDENNEMLQAYMKIVIGYLMKGLELKPKEKLGNEDVLYRLLPYMTEHFTQPLSLESVAKVLGINKYYLSKIFSEKIGCTFRNYLNLLRIEYAQKLLNYGQKSMVEIAYESGFGSERTFFRVFMERKGVTPLRYRKAALNLKSN